MSNRRDNKGFTKLAPTEELALSEMAAMNSGSELELLDLTSTETQTRREFELLSHYCYGWCVGCLLLKLSVVYLVYNMLLPCPLEHRVNLIQV